MKARMIKVLCDSQFDDEDMLHQELWVLDPPYEDNNFVVASASRMADAAVYETMVFASNIEGDITGWGEVACIKRLDCKAAIKSMGYQIVE